MHGSALAKAQTSQKVSTTTGIEQEESLLQEFATKEASFSSSLQELKKELKKARQELSRVQAEKEHLQNENCEIMKHRDVSDSERKNLRSELKDMKLRVHRLLMDNNELEKKSTSLQKQVSSLQSSQEKLKGAKHEVRWLKEEVQLRNAQLEELRSLQCISEQQLEQLREMLQSEREQKYALRRELDQQLTPESPMFHRDGLSQGEVSTTCRPSRVGDLFSELHLAEIREREKQIKQLETEKGHLSSVLEDVQQQLEELRSILGGDQRLVLARLVGPIRALIALHGEEVGTDGAENSRKPRKVDCPSNHVSGGSPRVHRPRARPTFTRPSAQEPEACEALGDTDVVPCSQSTVDSSEEVEVARLGQDKPLMDPHPDSPVIVRLQDQEWDRFIASQEARLSPAKHQRSLRTLVHEDGGDSAQKSARHTWVWLLANGPIRWQDELLENGSAPLDDHVPTNSVPAEQNIEEHGDSSAVHAEEACTTQESTDTEIYEDQLEAEEPVTKEVETSPHCEPSAASPTLANSEASEQCVLQLIEGFFARYSEGTTQASRASPEFGAPIPSSEDANRVQLAVDTEEQIGNVCPAGVDVHKSVSAGHSCPDICTVPETEDQATIESWERQSATDTAASKPESMLAQGKAVSGAHKRKRPSQTTSPTSSRLRAKQVCREQGQRSSSPPPDAAGGKPPPQCSGSSPALSRSRIMLDAAMQSVGSSTSCHTANVPFVQQSTDDGGNTGSPLSILKRRPPAEDGSPQGSPHRAKTAMVEVKVALSS
ncbi:uncharacterized protein LOC119398609 [Rhipicephalus sanguineus]|uniref:uncharacterized protein LOC119398609 n=1 Tax=Rhipicephalus sanguineus TaxID=34632 RepID=UPI00189487E5|nr:uncharacterized protein LOC119398609 [Rhipicephalus sanguineus]